jgi:pyruvate dehydrogenase E2 component (dihydrolipoamide acetyltransferase)
MSVDRDNELLEAVPLDGMRAVIARTMTQSLREMAQLTLHRQVETEQLVRYRESFDADSRPSFNDLVLSAVARTLLHHPSLNATLEADTISRWKHVHLGMAVAVDAGLVVPVIRNADTLSLPELRAEAARLGLAARDGKLRMPDIQGGTFTVSNLGGFGIDGFTPIVNPPQVAILGVGRIGDPSMTLSLTIDHRALDGVPGARFLQDLADALESPDGAF